jgi:hypothetical protein
LLIKILRLGLSFMRLINRVSVGVIAGLFAASLVSAQEDKALQPVVDAAKEINESAEISQQKINSLTDQIEDKLLKFKTINKEIDGLQVYNSQLSKQISSQQQEMLDLNSAMDDVSVVERQITPLMMKMIEGLEQFVALDVPFLPEERRARIADLKLMMDRADVAPSEKFRRVMEAYTVEMSYSKDIEAYSGLHTIEGQERNVDFLRIGRTALMYQTRDASLQGAWNKKTGQWEALSSSYKNQVTKGLRMAKKQMAPDLLLLPIAVTD